MDGDRKYPRPAQVFAGRRLELAALTAALDTARAGEPQVVLIQGEAGIGKSSLVCEFLGGQPGVPVVTASGEEAEAFLPHGLVQQLAAGAAAVSADAQAGLELLSQGPGADADPLTAGVKLLALISSLQGSETVAVKIPPARRAGWPAEPAAVRRNLAALRLDSPPPGLRSAGWPEPRRGEEPIPASALGRPGPLARLYGTAMHLGITVLEGAAGAGSWPNDSTAAIVSSGERIALNPGLDDGLRTDVLAMALIVAAVMGDRDTGHPCAITAPDGLVLISRTRVPRPGAGPGQLATLLARTCGCDTASAAFEYTIPAIN